MAKTRGDQLTTNKGKIVGKQQLYALLVDAAGNAILDTAGNEQLVEVHADASGRIKTLAELSGSITLDNKVAVAVGVATTEILPANANRKYALIVNDSDTVIYLGTGEAAVPNQGIRLNPNGGSYEMCAANGNLTLGAINGISSVAGKNVLPTEGV